MSTPNAGVYLKRRLEQVQPEEWYLPTRDDEEHVEDFVLLLHRSDGATSSPHLADTQPIVCISGISSTLMSAA